MRTFLLSSLALSASASISSCKSSDKCRYDAPVDLSLLQVSANPEVLGVLATRTRGAQDPAEGSVAAAAAANATENAANNGDNSASNSTEASTSSDNATTGGENVTNATKGTNVTNTSEGEEVSTTAAPTGCAVREDPRAKAWFAETSAPGTPCVFGVEGDVRDEGSHCIYDSGDFGSNGWCYTSKDRSSWGSCNDLCPLYGPSKQLGKKIDHMAKKVDKVLDALNKSDAPKDSKAKSADNNAEAPEKEAGEKKDAATEPSEPKALNVSLSNRR